MAASPVPDEEEQFHSGVEDEEELDDNIVLGARRSKASDDEGSDEDEGDKGGEVHNTQEADAEVARGTLDVNLPDDLEEGQVGEADADSKGRKAKPKLEPYMVPTSGAFYMHDDRFDDSVELAKPRRTTKKPKDEDRWKHDKFESLLNDEEDDEPPAHAGFRTNPRGRGRGRGRRGNFLGSGGRGDYAGPPPGFEDPGRPRRGRGRPHPAEVLKDLDGYDPNGFNASPRALNPDAKPFRSNTDERPRGGGGRGSRAYERDKETFGEDAVNEGRSYGGGQGRGRAGDEGAETEERPARGRGGGRRYSAMAGSLGGS